MKIRIISAIVALCIFVPILIFSETWVFAIAVALLSGIAVFEMLRCTGILKKYVISIPLLFLSVALPGIVKVSESLDVFLQYAVPTVLLTVLYLLCVMVFSEGTIPVADIAVPAFTAFYISFAFASLSALRYFDEMGKYTYLLVFIGAWICDTFAYFCGMLFGKHKLIPKVSPKKTVEGSIGGILFDGVFFVLYGVLLRYAFEVDFEINYILLFVYGLAAAVVSQIGDLSMSAIKRTYEIKDYGKIMPGHGGVLDRFDSILAVSVALFVLNEFSNVFG